MLPAHPPDTFRFSLYEMGIQGRKLEFMAISEQQQASMYVKIAGTLMVVLLVFGALQLAGIIR